MGGKNAPKKNLAGLNYHETNGYHHGGKGIEVQRVKLSGKEILAKKGRPLAKRERRLKITVRVAANVNIVVTPFKIKEEVKGQTKAAAVAKKKGIEPRNPCNGI